MFLFLCCQPLDSVNSWYHAVECRKLLFIVNSYDLLLTWKSRWMDDGIQSMDSLGLKVLSRTDYKLYTNITVDVGLPPANRPVVTVSYQSLFWSDLVLSYY